MQLSGERPRRSYLTELLVLANGTGRRLSAIRQLRFEDLRLERTPDAPHGALFWPARFDKMGYEGTIPVTAAVREGLERILAERPGIGAAWLFPAPGDPAKPLDRHLPDEWMRRAERLSGLEPLDGTCWHGYRRKWVTERKHWPLKDLARAGGWRGTAALLRCYVQADPQTTLQVVLESRALREARG
jgi:integrase